MSNKEVALWFDKAHASLAAGDFAAATNAFEYVISNFDAYASGIAERSLRWYCLPLETVFNQVQESKIPINIHEALAEVFQLGKHPLEAGLQRTFREIETGLSKLVSCVRVGEQYWISKQLFDETIQFAGEDIGGSSGLVLLATLIEQKWAYPSARRTALPDQITQLVFADNLAPQRVHTLAHGQCFISHRAVSNAIEAFHDFITKRQSPSRLKDFLADHFSTNLYLNELEVFFKGHLDTRFIELSPGVEFLVGFIKLDAVSLDDYFQEYLKPLSSTELLIQVFFKTTDQITKLSPRFIKFANRQLSRNSNLCHFANDQWVSSSQIDQLLNRVVENLKQQENPLPTKELLEKVESIDSLGREQFELLAGLVEAKFRQSPVLIDTGNSRWLHRDALNRACEQIYQYLVDSKHPQSTGSLLQEFLKLSQYSFSRGFLGVFEKTLSSDGRFSSQTINRLTYWQGIDPSYQHHQQFYQILTQRHTLLTVDQILSLIPEGPEIDLAKVDISLDKRFKAFPDGRWGLSHWVWLNDLAFDYIAKTHQYYHANVIVGFVCQEKKIPQQDAIFLPAEDSRFVKDSLNRWGIVYRLKFNDIDRIHAELVQRMGLGCSVDQILNYVTQLPPHLTDVEEVLSGDNRFINIDGKWFARESAFYQLRESDLDIIYDFLASFTRDQLPIPIGNLIQEVLGRDARLTNAEEQLKSDDRFQEIFAGFWVFSGFEFTEIDRARYPLGNIHVRSDRTPLSIEEAIQLPAELTLRKDARRLEKPPTTTSIKKAYITLTHLDVLHGNLRVSGVLRQIISDDSDAIRFEDDENYEFLGQLDETRSILHIRPWLEKRGLTFGDKVSIQPGRKDKLLFIKPYGERDQRVFQEAIQHQDVEKLIEEARRIGKSYHDLMIEVMEALNLPLHREDIFQLVDYQRTASRNTVFEILSLVDCPYEELRYFVSVGRGYWSFDRKRKEAYDMKMQELIQQNSALKGDIAMLNDRWEAHQVVIKQSGSKDFENQLSSLNQKISQVEAERNALSQDYEQLKSQMDQQIILNDQLSSQLELLQLQNSKLEEQAAKVETQNKEFVLTIDQLTALKGKIFQVEAERDTITQDYAQLNAEMRQQKARGEGLASQIELLVAQNQKREEYIAQQEVQTREFTLHIDQLKLENSSLQETLENSRQHEIISQTRLEDLQAELVKYKDEKSKLQNELALQVKKIDETQDRLRAVEEENRKQLNELQERLRTYVEALQFTENKLELEKEQAAQNSLKLVEVQNELNSDRRRLDRISRALGTPLGKLFSHILRIS